ncbi:SPS1-related proline-alanine-rich protein kinase [Seminavis robusta]|uniref:SPS1-related proline-alanine-rich protein kinase n=1 Tax=Seminavis robusta TaxID=568900 RepID=A0A9N8F3W3_9STRA|nr:SPS1-related proline-alanine-rich protein kinase [Seminavis robusta]|eukprot:Sro2811_g337610.1 SPS1-related proline-alanine-rich protein kinase (429) ;mRNA; f:1486-2965
MPRLFPTARGVRKTLSGSSHKGSRHDKYQNNHTSASHSTCTGISLTEGDADWIVRKTETRVAETVAKSNYIQKHCKLYKLPRFALEDLEMGELLANGGFCEVREIKSFLVSNDLDRNSVDPKRYVIKHLAPKLVSKPKQLAIGAKDLVMEGFVLSSLNHENILEVKGFASSGVSGYAATGRIDGFFLVLPRLDKTLHRQLHEWKVAVRRQKKLLRKASDVSGDASAAVPALEEASSSEEAVEDSAAEEVDTFDPEQFPFCAARIQTAVEVSSAIAYCHRNRILYRDLKPANVGYCFEEDRVKLFDFGLAVELPPSNDPDKGFKLPGNTGTARYMAPEVVRSEPYGFKADVYSFCVLLHEIMALAKPFEKFTGQEVKEQVATLGRRPAIDKSWPLSVRKLLRRGFSDVTEIRPSMEDIQDILEDLVDCF